MWRKNIETAWQRKGESAENNNNSVSASVAKTSIAATGWRDLHRRWHGNRRAVARVVTPWYWQRHGSISMSMWRGRKRRQQHRMAPKIAITA